jgi:SlyX protein
MARNTDLEETMAHLVRMVDELSDIVARQDGEISRLSRRLEMLMAREAERQLDEGGSLPMADQKPPHW